MASPFQQQSRRRKLVYTGLILLLFAFTTFGWRGLEFRGAPPPSWTVAGQANALKLRERNQGDVELTGSAISLGLTGSKGFVVCALWQFAQEAQKRHEWNELELLVRSLTKLQPHFITPWLFQSWNLAYNVSVESDLVKDKYFYIARGINLLGDGERKNRDHPDLRFSIGFYNQHKIGLADESRTLRCLYQLSCIPPGERDPNRLRRRGEGGRTEILPEKFEEFCQKHPMLVRRLREQLRFETPEEIVDFLDANWKLPSRFADAAAGDAPDAEVARLKPALEQFPVLPPRFSDAEPHDDVQELGDAFDNFTCAKAWFAYSLLPLPEPSATPSMFNPPYDRNKHRMPRYMAVQIFRGYPSRGQTFIAETQQKEGWFDRDGWLVKNWFKDDKFSDGRPAAVGGGTYWARDGWEKSFQMWQYHGTITGLYKTPEELKSLDDEAAVYRKALALMPMDRTMPIPPDKLTPAVERGFAAHDQLYWYDRNREMTNYPHFYHKSQIEMKEETILGRKLAFEAEQLRSREGLYDEALDRYAQAAAAWRKLMMDNPEFGRDVVTREDAYELQLRYLDLVQKRRGRRIKEVSLLTNYLAQAAARAPSAFLWLPPMTLVREVQVPISGPFDVKDRTGAPLIDEDTRSKVRQRMGLPDPMQQWQPPPTSDGSPPVLTPAPPPKPLSAPPPGGPG